MPDTYADKIARIKDLVSLATETKNIVVDHETIVNDFETRIGTLETGISSLESGNSTLQTGINTLETRINTLESGATIEIPGINCYHNAGSHNAIFRGKDLGTEVTTEQYAAINAGTFEGLYIGDFWNKTINIKGKDETISFRIADFDYYYNTDATNTHHVVIVPDSSIGYDQIINGSNSDKQGYALSYMRSTGLNDAKSKINTAFGTSHILTYNEYLESSVDENGIVTGVIEKNDCTIELMSETMVYGHRIVSPQPAISGRYVYHKTQLSLFRLKPDLMKIKINDNNDNLYWWLRDYIQYDPQTGGYFTFVDQCGAADSCSGHDSACIRPFFLIH